MKDEDKDKTVLEYIVRHCDRISRAIERFGGTYQDFVADEAFRDSVSMNIQQIGELVGHLSEKFKSNTENQIPWKQIRAMRNLFAHDYSNMSTEKIWQTASADVPVLRSFCEQQVKLFEQ